MSSLEGGDGQKMTSDDMMTQGGYIYPPKMMTSFMSSPLVRGVGEEYVERGKIFWRREIVASGTGRTHGTGGVGGQASKAL